MKEIVLSENQKKAWHDFLIAHAVSTRQIDSKLNKNGQIGLDVYDILATLDNAEDKKLRMSELADKKAFSRSGLTRLIDRLEKLGYVRREPCPRDGRGFFAVLTPAGKQAKENAWPTFEDSMKKTWAINVSDQKARELSVLFDRIIKNVSEDT